MVVVGCGRVGAGLPLGWPRPGTWSRWSTRTPRRSSEVGEEFSGQTVEGIGFDRDVLEQAGAASADALVAGDRRRQAQRGRGLVAGGDAYRVPRVIARIHDPVGPPSTRSSTTAVLDRRAAQDPRLPGAPHLKEEGAFGRGEVTLLRLELPSTWSTARWPTSRKQGPGGSASPAGAGRSSRPATAFAEGDVVRLAVGATATRRPRRPAGRGGHARGGRPQVAG